ncbi:hypothetical protein A4X13_0g5650 [Tilletia indica]|uniref:Ndc10 domain-containing protein n=1 Tax=Tilletia indica TaxID=43049 RepID=A0A177TRD6_9BASI|nr:hypothetical protein A4X13_0g5650 [Tilletia indica]
MDDYNREQMRLVVNHFVDRNGDAALRDCVCFLLSHFALLRGDDLRPIELADIHHLDMRNEGPGDRFAVMLLLQHGKTNKHGRVEFGSFMRNKDAAICPVAFLSIYLFSRFHVLGLPTPDFTSSDKWYPLKLFRANKGTAAKAIGYDTQLDTINAAFKAAAIVGSAKTHLSRRSGAQMAELGGGEEGQVRRAGRLNAQVMELCYLSAVPREVLRVHAGFSKEGGNFFLARDIEVKEELLKKVFPWLDEWDAAIGSGKLASGKRVETNIAARGFVRLLLRLRKVIVQDAVVLRKEFPKWYVWSHSLFSDPLFLQYERDANAVLDAAVSPDDRLQKTVPLIAESIDASTVNIQQTIASGFVAVGARLDTFSHQQQPVQVEQQRHHDAQIRALQYQFKALATMVATGFSVLTGAPPSPITSSSTLPPSSITGSSPSTSTALLSISSTSSLPLPGLGSSNSNYQQPAATASIELGVGSGR